MDARKSNGSGGSGSASNRRCAGATGRGIRTTCARDHRYPPVVHAIMFWALASVAMVLFAACVLVPIWAEARDVRAYEEAMVGIIAQLDAEMARNQARIDALRTDPLVNERIVRRELNYHPEGEGFIPWTANGVEDGRSCSPCVASGERGGSSVAGWASSAPPWVKMLKRWLPAWPWQDLFGRSPSRPLLLIMAGALLLTAFVLYTPSRAPKPDD